VTFIVSRLSTDRDEENEPVDKRTAVAAVSPADEMPAAPMAQKAPVMVAVPVIENDAAAEVAFEPADAAENEGVTREETVLSTCGDGDAYVDAALPTVVCRPSRMAA
jgi:hypothetical protein